MGTKPIPEGYHTLTTYLAVDDASEAIDWYKQAFGAKERMRMDTPDGKIGHAEIQIGDSLVMLSDPFPQATTKPDLSCPTQSPDASMPECPKPHQRGRFGASAMCSKPISRP